MIPSPKNENENIHIQWLHLIVAFLKLIPIDDSCPKFIQCLLLDTLVFNNFDFIVYLHGV